ncbi:fatty acid desaturase [Ningiella sp. W23]|uniref:fatty acid desaturase n=1 Tax=Ningiella sp. W23 TaxID=3023715 RepID=UPI003756680F
MTTSINKRETSSRDSIRAIVRAIKEEEATLRQRYGFLVHQNALGMIIMLLALSGMITTAALYYYEMIPAWVCILVAAFFASISHELEHDLIHKQYFSKKPMIHNAMMLIVWLMRPNTINPWYRRKIHLHHHAVSGTEQDLEERLVGNGIKNPFKRLLVIMDGLLGLIVFRNIYNKEIKDFSFARVFHAAFPVSTAYFVVLYSVIAYYIAALFFPVASYMPAWALSVMSVFEFLMVVLIVPNIVRSTSLNLITSSMHYYGGVNNVIQQTHVLTSRWFLPFQLFCFNFGKTHSIHHFVPNQPFYIRQLISDKVNEVLRLHGVRFNDLQSIKRANLYTA